MQLTLSLPDRSAQLLQCFADREGREDLSQLAIEVLLAFLDVAVEPETASLAWLVAADAPSSLGIVIDVAA